MDNVLTMANGKRKIFLIVHNVRSAHNVGSLLRTADGLGVDEVILSGYSPYPKTPGDVRLPHQAEKTHNRLAKTALGAEASVNWRQVVDINPLLQELRAKAFVIAALEQTPSAIQLNQYSAPPKIALIVGNEISGLDAEVLADSDVHLQIPMLGAKESLNVSVAAAIALYHLANC